MPAIRMEIFRNQYNRYQQINYIETQLDQRGLTVYGEIIGRYDNWYLRVYDSDENYHPLFSNLFEDANAEDRRWIQKIVQIDGVQLQNGDFLIGDAVIEVDNTIVIFPIKTFDTQEDCALAFRHLQSILVDEGDVNEADDEDGDNDADVDQDNNVDTFANRDHNFILSGAPGVGKSRLVSTNIIHAITGLPDDSEHDKNPQVERIAFTPGTMFEDFWGAYKPVPVESKINDEDQLDQEEEGQTVPITYGFVAGPAAKIVREAYYHPDKKYVLVIEELNRAQVYDVFGNLFQLLDRKDSYHISLSEDCANYFQQIPEDAVYTEKMGDKLALPKNLFIICTMNPADQNVYTLDTAFLRRFTMGYLDIDGELWCSKKAPVDFNNLDITCFSGYGESVPKDVREKILKHINDSLKNEGKPDDKLLSGHFVKDEADDFEFLVKIINYLQTIYRIQDEPPRCINSDYFYKSISGENMERVPQFRLNDVLLKYRKSKDEDGKNMRTALYDVFKIEEE